MTETITEAMKKDGPELVPRIGETIGRTARASLAYGEPIHREGITVVPVAKVRYGFGAGTGRRGDEETGNGGGGGVQASPLGYIEVRDGRSRFRRIRDPSATTARIAVVGGLAVLLVGSVRRLMGR